MVVAVLAVILAIVPLNFTILFAGVRSKFVPVIVTVVPTRPLAGVTFVMVGTAAVREYLNNVPRAFAPPSRVTPYKKVPSEKREP